MLGAPELDAGLQVGSDESRIKGQNPLPRPAAHAALDAAQDTVGFLGCQRTLPAHGELLTHQHPQALLEDRCCLSRGGQGRARALVQEQGNAPRAQTSQLPAPPPFPPVGSQGALVLCPSLCPGQRQALSKDSFPTLCSPWVKPR